MLRLISLVTVACCLASSPAMSAVRIFHSDNHAVASYLDFTLAIGPKDAYAGNVTLTPVAELGRLSLDAETILSPGLFNRYGLVSHINLEEVNDRVISLGPLGTVELDLNGLSMVLQIQEFEINNGKFNLKHGFLRSLRSEDGSLMISNPTGAIGTLFANQFPVALNLQSNPIQVPDFYFSGPVVNLPGATDNGPGLLDPKAEFNFSIFPLPLVIDDIGPSTNLYIVISGNIYTAVPEVPSLGLMAVGMGLAVIAGQLARRRARTCPSMRNA